MKFWPTSCAGAETDIQIADTRAKSAGHADAAIRAIAEALIFLASRIIYQICNEWISQGAFHGCRPASGLAASRRITEQTRHYHVNGVALGRISTFQEDAYEQA